MTAKNIFAACLFCAALQGQMIDYNRQIKNKPPAPDPRLTVNLATYGVKCDGVTDDSAAMGIAASSGAGQKVTIQLPGTCYVPSGFAVPSGVTFTGPGKLLGAPVVAQGMPTTLITATGALTGSAIPMGASIFSYSTAFTAVNSFAANDMFLLSNFPTAAGGSDACTILTDPVFGSFCTYPVSVLGNNSAGAGPNNLRQNRRLEVGQIRSATGTAFTVYGSIVNDYVSTQQLQFQKVAPVQDIRFRDAGIDSIKLICTYCQNFALRGGRVVNSFIEVDRSLNTLFDPDSMEATNMDGSIALGGGSRYATIRGSYSGGNIPSDNGLVRIDQASDVTVNVEVHGASAGLYPIIVDTDYAENPTGYTDVPDKNIVVRAVIDGGSLGVLVSSSYLATGVYNLSLDVAVRGYQQAPDANAHSYVQLGLATSVSLHMMAPQSWFTLYGSQNVQVSGQMAGQFMSQGTEGAATGTVVNNRAIIYDGVDFIGGPVDTVTSYAWNFCDQCVLKNVHWDRTATLETGVLALAQFSNGKDLTLGNLSVTNNAAQTQWLLLAGGGLTGTTTNTGGNPFYLFGSSWPAGNNNTPTRFGGMIVPGDPFASDLTNLGTPQVGAIKKCSNCQSPSNPCLGGGTGTVAIGVSGAWKCL
jgi:hypothetical protein